MNENKNKDRSNFQGYSEKAMDDFFSGKRDFSDDVENIKVTAPPKKKSKKVTKSKGFRKFMTGVFTFLISIFLIFVITGTIVSAALTFYVIDFMDDTADVTIEELELTYNTYVYAYNSDEELVKLYEVSNGGNQSIPVEIDDLPQYVRDAFVYTEDERFYNHDGVDYKRTFSAFLNMFMHFYNTNQGGSTITQQLIKNITGDDEQSPSRKIREIFRAMQLEKRYSKDEILVSYLNYIGFGGSTIGIEAASEKYFGKHVKDLDVAEAASLAAIPKSPNTYNPFADKKANKERQEYVLKKMYENGAISYDKYQESIHEHLIFTDSDEYHKFEDPNEPEEIDLYDSSQATTWVVDTAINEFAEYLSQTYNLSHSEAISRINKGGYQIYTTVDLEMQDYVENKYKDITNLMDLSLAQKTLDDGSVITPQSAFIAMDYTGQIKCVVGAVGAKTESLCWNYATMEQRQPGSAIKPVSTYGAGIENDVFAWGSKILDYPIEVNGELWPTNYSTNSSKMSYSNKEVNLYYGLEKSLNTISARICEALTPNKVFAFSTEKMGLDLLDKSEDGTATDNDLSPLSVGALSYGVTLDNLVNAYVPYGNLGMYYKSHIISKVEQGNHELVYENDGSPYQAVSEDTAYVMNKLLQNVVKNGTGTAAQLQNKTVAGKTGTTQNWNDLLFVGMTEDFVSGVWIGYPERQQLSKNIKSAQVWQNVVGGYADSIDSGAEYPKDDKVICAYVCENTGDIATERCPKGEVGYWKESNAPVCSKCGGSKICYAKEDGTPVDSSLYYQKSYSYSSTKKTTEDEGNNDSNNSGSSNSETQANNSENNYSQETKSNNSGNNNDSGNSGNSGSNETKANNENNENGQ